VADDEIEIGHGGSPGVEGVLQLIASIAARLESPAVGWLTPSPCSGTQGALDRAGQPIGGNDLLIAAQALSLGYAVVTDNQREFARLDGLHSENWLH
jgi:tRNA(fMet)-specific endonuclease VapC